MWTKLVSDAVFIKKNLALTIGRISWLHPAGSISFQIIKSPSSVFRYVICPFWDVLLSFPPVLFHVRALAFARRIWCSSSLHTLLPSFLRSRISSTHFCGVTWPSLLFCSTISSIFNWFLWCKRSCNDKKFPNLPFVTVPALMCRLHHRTNWMTRPKKGSLALSSTTLIWSRMHSGSVEAAAGKLMVVSLLLFPIEISLELISSSDLACLNDPLKPSNSTLRPCCCVVRTRAWFDENIGSFFSQRFLKLIDKLFWKEGATSIILTKQDWTDENVQSQWSSTSTISEHSWHIHGPIGCRDAIQPGYLFSSLNVTKHRLSQSEIIDIKQQQLAIVTFSQCEGLIKIVPSEKHQIIPTLLSYCSSRSMQKWMTHCCEKLHIVLPTRFVQMLTKNSLVYQIHW